MDYPSSVFLSFRREDTGRTFVSHLYRSLDEKGIRTRKDVNPQAEDTSISPEFKKAIGELEVAVVVISENYASSVRCLDILAAIIEHSRITTPITVFYEVDPGDLTSPTGKFAEDIRRHEERENPETVNRWRDALKQLATAKERTYCSRNWEDDSKMLDDLIICISAVGRGTRKAQLSSMIDQGSSNFKLMSDTYTKHIPKSLSELERYAHQEKSLLVDISNDSPYPASDDDSNGLVGMSIHKKAVHGLLDLECKDTVRTVGIWGTQGVGKSTLAECVFDEISPHFQHHYFLTNVNNSYRQCISPSLLKHLTRTSTSNDIFAAIKPSLANRNVLLVIDGLDGTHDDHFKDAMMVIHWLGPGSRVIMTSDNERSLLSRGVKRMYKMECLGYEEALQLFSLFAFRKTCPLIGFEGFSVRAVHFAGRLPLALKVLGSILHDKDEEFWKITLQKLKASQDDGNRQVSNYIGGSRYLPRGQTQPEQYIVADEQEQSSYFMLL